MQDATLSPESECGLPAFAIYKCPNCRNFIIAETRSIKTNDRIQCRTCFSEANTDRIRIRAHAETREEIRELRTRMCAAVAGDEAWANGEYDDWATLLDRIEDVQIGPSFDEAENRLGSIGGIDGLSERADEVLGSIGVDAGLAEQAEASLGSIHRDSALADRAERVLGTIGTDQRPDLNPEIEQIPDEPPSIASYSPESDARTPGLTIEHTASPDVSDAILTRTPATPRDWTPEVLEQLVPLFERAVRLEATQLGESTELAPASVVRRHLADRMGLIGTAPDDLADMITASQEWLGMIVDLAYDRVDDREKTVERITRLGTGAGAWNAGVEALTRGPIALLACLSEPIGIVLKLDGPSWTEASAAQLRRAQDVLDRFAVVADVRIVATQRVHHRIRNSSPDWYENHLTQALDASRDCSDDETLPDGSDAYEIASEFCPGSGPLRILAALAASGERQQRTLADDTEVDLAAGSVDRYVGELEAVDLIDVDRTGRHNEVALTPLGERAAGLLDDDYCPVPPEQETLPQLSTRLSDPPYDPNSTVYRASTSSGGATPGAPGAPPGDGQSAAEASTAADTWLAMTGDPDETESFVQPLDGPDKPHQGVLGRYGMHRRLSAVARPGLTFVDDHDLEAFDDQRVAYMSAFDDTAVCVIEWSQDPLITLTRIANALLSDFAMNKILTRDRIGDALEEIVAGDLDSALIEILQKALQFGWLREEDAEYDRWRNRWQGVANRLLSRIGTSETNERINLLRDAHGLLCAASLLYQAVGIDVQVHVRMPDVQYIRRDSKHRQNFLGFIQHTVPKQASYRVHSAFRNLLEHRESKLEYRIPPELDPKDPTADLSVDWVFTGPGISDFATSAHRELEQLEEEELREQVTEGREEMFVLEIPVHKASSTAGLAHVIDQFAEQKGYRTDELRELATVCQSLLGGVDHRASAYDVAEAMLYLEQSSGGGTLSLSDIEYALGQLPAERLAPELPPTMQQALKVLLMSDEPLAPAEIINQADISRSSWERNWDALAALGLVQETEERTFEISLLPWWSPFWWSPTNEPIPNAGGPTSTAAAIEEILDEVELDIDDIDLVAMANYPDSSDPPDWRVAAALAIAQPHFESWSNETVVARSRIGTYPIDANTQQVAIA